MPQVEGGYTALDSANTNGHVGSSGGAIYQSTTEPTGPQSVFESMKRAIGQVVGTSGNGTAQDTDDLLAASNGRQAMVVGTRTARPNRVGKVFTLFPEYFTPSWVLSKSQIETTLGIY
ncbi:unnamed protein product [Ceratitis capitata]|uniref:(Mediterranean fruit fly) hypothetical protein n=1 Tax=Ceratitis capitata TaxID=7213 RepID=A0A811VM93_CERCA|nr:unnamed protein product [Ceratitis capitata]